MKFIELTKEKLMSTNGGNEFSDSFWTIVGFIARAFVAFSEGASSGGYAACKCP